MKTLFIVALALASIAPAYAQKEIPKAEGHDQCPLGYVNTLGSTCVSPIYYEVAPTNGEACHEGWMNEQLNVPGSVRFSEAGWGNDRVRMVDVSERL